MGLCRGMKGSTFIIAEVGQAHDGSLGILHSYIDAAAEAGVDAVKFQTHIATAESSEFEQFRVKFSYQDNTRYDYWSRMELTKEQWSAIKKHCDDVGVEFISSPFSVAAVELLEELGVETYKVGSGELTNFLMMDRIARTGKRVILSSGMSSYEELGLAFKRFERSSCQVDLLQCTTMYPTPYESVGLNVIPELIRKFPNSSVGLSDHSGSILPSLAAVSVGASILEAHIVFDRRMFGPDSTSSLDVNDFKNLVAGVRAFETLLTSEVNKDEVSRDLSAVKAVFGKSLAVSSDVRAGDTICLSLLESKKPAGIGIPASDYESIVGRRFSRDLRAWSFITIEDIV